MLKNIALLKIFKKYIFYILMEHHEEESRRDNQKPVHLTR